MQDMRRLLYFDFSKVFFCQSTTEKSPSTPPCGRICLGTFFPNICFANPSSHCGQLGASYVKNPVRFFGKVGKRWYNSRMVFFSKQAILTWPFLSLLFFGVGVLNGSFPRILKVFFQHATVIFFGGRTGNKRWTWLKRSETMCKHDEIAGICTFFVSSKGLGVCLKGFERPWNEQLPFIFVCRSWVCIWW